MIFIRDYPLCFIDFTAPPTSGHMWHWQFCTCHWESSLCAGFQ